MSYLSKLRVEEQDGDPAIERVSVLKVANDSLTDEDNGTASIDTGGGGGGGGGGGTPINPDDITGLELWLKADAITGLSDGDPVGTWEDSSSANNDATQATAGNKPLYKRAIVNGLAVVRFDDSNDGMGTPWVPSHPFSCFFVARFMGANGNRRLLAGSNNWLVGPYGGLWRYYQGSFTTGEPGAGQSWTVIGIIQEASRSDLFLFDLPFGGHANAAPGLPGTMMLASSGIFSEPAGCDVAEIVGYSASISDADRLGLVAYFRDKYAI